MKVNLIYFLLDMRGAVCKNSYIVNERDNFMCKSPSDIIQTDRSDNLVVAMEAAIKGANIPFLIYDANFFSGEGVLAGDWLVISESPESEYAMVIETITMKVPVSTIAGLRAQERTFYKVYHPYYDEGDASVGMDDAWIIDFDDANPNLMTDSITDACLNVVNWFLDKEIRMQMDNALSAQEFQANHSINPED